MSYKIQIDDVVRDATVEEIAAIEANRETVAAQEAAAQAAAKVRASALAKLAELGLTPAELAALVG
jgi:hypothetical protein